MPSRDQIRPLVLHKIAAITHQAETLISETDQLERDLGMTVTVRRPMALPYTRIVPMTSRNMHISMDEAGKLKTVGESMDLVAKRATVR